MDERLKIFGADMEGENLFEVSSLKTGLVVIGNEGNGIENNNRAFIDQYLNIPKCKRSKGESLNAAISMGIICAWIKNS